MTIRLFFLFLSSCNEISTLMVSQNYRFQQLLLSWRKNIKHLFFEILSRNSYTVKLIFVGNQLICINYFPMLIMLSQFVSANRYIRILYIYEFDLLLLIMLQHMTALHLTNRSRISKKSAYSNYIPCYNNMNLNKPGMAHCRLSIMNLLDIRQDIFYSHMQLCR